MSFTHSEFMAAVGAAILAPSLHNSQPWRFRLTDDQVHVLADSSRTTSGAGPDGWADRIACGAATYNLRLALAANGQPTELRWRPVPGVMAVLNPMPRRPPTSTQLRLFRAIPRRHSNRRPFRAEPVPPEARRALIRAATDNDAWLELVVGRIPVAAVGEIAQAANRILQRTSARAGELSAAAFSDLLRSPGPGIDGEPLVAVLGTAGDSPGDHLQAGYALQHLLLTVVDHGLASSMISQPIEVPSAREQLRIALGRYGPPQMVLRVGYGEAVSAMPRRPVAAVISAE